ERHVQRYATERATRHALQHEAQHPRSHQRQTSSETGVNDDAGEQHDPRQQPIAPAGEILGEVVRRSEADGWEEHKRGGNAEVRRVEDVLVMAVADWRAENDLRTD